MAHLVERVPTPVAPKPARMSKAERERNMLQRPLSWELTRKLGGELQRLGAAVNLDITKGTMTLTGRCKRERERECVCVTSIMSSIREW